MTLPALGRAPRWRRVLPLVPLVPLVLVPCLVSALQETPADPSAPLVATFAELALTIELPAGAVEDPEPSQPPLLGAWTATRGSIEIRAELLVADALEHQLADPEDVADHWREQWVEPPWGGPRAAFAAMECVPGEYGAGGYVALLRGRRQPSSGAARGIFSASGLATQQGWTLRLEATPEPGEEDARVLRELLLRVRCTAAPRDPKWSDEMLRQRWLHFSPETAEELAPPARSAHYIVLSDGKDGAAFSKKLESYYTLLKKTLAFEETPPRSLLPVYLFDEAEEYHDYYERRLANREHGMELWGHLEGKLYVTYSENLDNPAHLFHAVQQVLRGRLRLHGGGQWFDVGLAEYLSTKESQRNAAAKRVKSGEVPLSGVLQGEWFPRTTHEDPQQRERYAELALVLEFLCESKWAKPKFPQFLRSVGAADDEDPAAIEAALTQVYGVDLAGLEKQWVDYCKKR